MKTLALKYSESKAPDCGTVQAHNELIDKFGYVWFGKFGTNTNRNIIREILESGDPKILLVSGKQKKIHWAYINEVTTELSELEAVPDYYRRDVDRVKTWFKVIRFEEVSQEILSQFIVSSSKKKLISSLERGMSSSYLIESTEI